MEPEIAEKDVKAPNLIERAKEEVDAVIHVMNSSIDEGFERANEKIYQRETHGMNSSIDEDTPIDQIKGPNMFQRAQEELEALAETVRQKKTNESNDKTEDGFWSFIGWLTQRFCSPSKKND